MGALRQYITQLRDDDVPGLSAELAYRFLFALFPFALFLAALSAFVAGWLGIGDPTTKIMDTLGNNLPSNLVGPIREQLQSVVGQARPDLLSISALVTIYSSAGGINALMKAMNRAYDIHETRPLLVRLALAVLLTVLAGIGILLSFVVVVGGSILTENVASRAGGAGFAFTAISLLRWPVVFLVLALAASVLFRYAANTRPPWRWAFTGAVAFAVGWLVATFVFGLYVSKFGHFDKTYGALGAVIVLMLWFYITAMVLVAAAELVALLVRMRAPQVLLARRSDQTVPAEAPAAEPSRPAEPAPHPRPGLAAAADDDEADAAGAGAGSST